MYLAITLSPNSTSSTNLVSLNSIFDISFLNNYCFSSLVILEGLGGQLRLTFNYYLVQKNATYFHFNILNVFLYLYTLSELFWGDLFNLKMAMKIMKIIQPKPLNICSLRTYQRTGKRMAPQHRRSTSMKTCCHMAYSDCPSSLSSIMM